MEFDILREVLIKSDAETDLRYGRDPNMRPIEQYINLGVVNIDKPKGPTSHQVTSWVRNMLRLKKAGHSGTLDPAVTGVLPIGLGNATAIVQALLPFGKEYVTLMMLHGDSSKKQVKKVFEYFNEKIYQRPPLKSSVKRELRIREIYKIHLIQKKERYVLFRVFCEAGTYIRKLCHDAGLVLGTGAHMQQLRRTSVAYFNESNIVTLYDLKDAFEIYREKKDESELRRCIMPMEKGIQHLKKIWVNDYAVDSISHGSPLHAPGVSKLETGIERDDLIGIFTLKNEIAALGTSTVSSKEICDLTHGTVAVPTRVLMKAGTYPKGWKRQHV